MEIDSCTIGDHKFMTYVGDAQEILEHEFKNLKNFLLIPCDFDELSKKTL